jgi:hypothetical protein
MAISDSQKVDLLYKKIAWSVAKTDTNPPKEAYNESNPSPLLIRADTMWQQSGSIPASIPSATSSIVQVYKDGAGSWSPTVECTELAVTDNRTWSTGLTNWIDPQFGATYFVKVYVDTVGSTTPQTTGTALQAAGINDDQWYFDYQAGILNFIGTNLPASIATGVTGKSVFISGARYIGAIGASNFTNGLTLGNISVTGNTITSDTGVSFSSNITGNLIGTLYGNTIGTTATYSGNITSGNITSGGNIAANYFLGNGSQLSGVSAPITVSEYFYGNIANVVPHISTLRFDRSTGFNVVDLGSNTALISMSSAFKTWVVPGQANIVAFGEDTIQFDSDSNFVLTTRPDADALNFKTLKFAISDNFITGNITANSSITGRLATANQPNITALGNLGNLRVVGNITSNNIIATTFYGNLLGNTTGVHTGNVVGTVLTANQPYITNLGNLGNLVVNGNISSTNTISSAFYGNIHADRITPLLSMVTEFDSIGAIGLPHGSTIQRPGLSKAGYLRYNTDIPSIEYYNGTTWVPVTNVISSQIVTPDGTSQSYQLNQTATEAGVIVSINGTVQQPGTAYSIDDKTITFSEIPQVTDIVDVRFLGATVSINTSLADNLEVAGNLSATGTARFGNIIATGFYYPDGTAFTGGNANVITSGGSNYSDSNVKSYLSSFNGNIIPSANLLYSLGSPTSWWKDLYISSNTIYIGGKPLTANVQSNVVTYNNQIIGGAIYTKQSTAPSNPKVGDQWYDTDYDVLYEYINDGTHSTWVDITGPFGVAGVQGEQGPQGDPGNDGTSVIILGSVPDFVDLPTWGNLTYGEGFIIQATGNLAVYDGSNFQDVGTIKGPKGDKGETGATGSQGIQGIQGPAGINGSNYLNFGNITANANLNLVTGTLNFVSSNGVKIDINDPADTATIYLDSTGNINVYSVTSRFAENVVTGTVPSSYTPDWSAGTIHNYTATQNFTLNAPINMPVGGSMTIVVTQDSSGNRTMTANSYYKFASSIKTLSTSANSVDMMNFVRTGTNTYLTVLTKGYA